MAKGASEEYNPKRRPPRITKAEWDNLARNYNELRTINDSLQKEINELKQRPKKPKTLPIEDWGMDWKEDE